MKILHVTQNYFPSKGGPQYIMKHLSEKLVTYFNDEVQVGTTNSMYGPETKLFQKVSPEVELLEQVEVRRLPFRRWHYPVIDLANKVHAKATGRGLPHQIMKLRWGLDSVAIDKMMADTAANVIMATTVIYNFADYPFWRFKSANPKPFILYGAIHLHKELPLNSPLIKRAKACDCYIANTDFEKAELVRYGVDANKIVTIGIGIEPEDFNVSQAEVAKFKAEHGITETDLVIGYVGRLVKGKGVPVLIDAFRRLHAENQNLKLLLAGGTTDYVPEIKRIIEQEKLPIVLIENFDDSLKAVLYNALDIFVLASKSESFGIVFLEAWASKKPVIGTNMGAIRSLLSNGNDSLLFEPDDPGTLTSTLQILINKPELRQKFGLNGYQKVIDHYTWPKIVAKYREAYLLGLENFQSLKKNQKQMN